MEVKRYDDGFDVGCGHRSGVGRCGVLRGHTVREQVVIESLSLQNFQAHRKFRAEFGEGITTIVGRSDVGKSAIIRALRWAATNQPGGDQFITTGTKGTSVTLRVDGRVIKRKRGGSVNTYHLDDEEYKAFGRGVPGPVVDALNMPAVCWQGQHDAPFWFSETGGEVARRLNGIVNLTIIDDTLANVVSMNHAARVRMTDATEKERAAAMRAAELEGVPIMAHAWHGVETAFEGLDHKEHDLDKLSAMVGTVRRAKARLDRAASMADTMAGVAIVANETNEVTVRRKRLSGLVKTVFLLVRSMERMAVPDLGSVRQDWNGVQEAREFKQDITDILGRCEVAEENYRQAKQQAEQAEKQVKELGVCPTCKR